MIFSGDYSFFVGPLVTPGLMVKSPLGFKAREQLKLRLVEAHALHMPKTHPWCDTCQPLDHRANLFHIPATMH